MIELTIIRDVPKPPPLPFMVVYNPTVEMLNKLIPILDAEMSVCLPICYGDVEDVPDFSKLESTDRIVLPYYSGKTLQSALAVTEYRMESIYG